MTAPRNVTAYPYLPTLVTGVACVTDLPPNPTAMALQLAGLTARLGVAQATIAVLRLTVSDLRVVADAAEEYHWTHYCDGIGAKPDAAIRADFTTAIDTYRRTRGIRELPPVEDDIT